MQTGHTLPPPDVGGEGEVVASIQVLSLTANRLVASDATKTLVSVSALSSWVAGTASQLTVTDDGDGTITLSLNTNLYSDGAHAAAFRSGANAQLVSIYGTYTDASNYERLNIDHVGGYARVWTQGAGTGTPRALRFGVASTMVVDLLGSGHLSWVTSNAYDVGVSGATPRDVYAGRQFIAASGSAAAPSVAVGEVTSGLYLAAGSLLRVSLGGTAKVAIDGVDTRFYVASNWSIGWSSSTDVAAAGPDITLSRVSAGVGKVTNGASACEWRVHGDATKYALLGHDGTDARVGASSGSLFLQSNAATRWIVDAATGILYPNGSNTIDLATSSVPIRTGYFGTALVVGTNPATVGTIALANAATIYARNAANNANILALDVTSGNTVRLAGGGDDIQWGTVLIALGGGAAPTLGTIGGSGPATAAQNSWMRVIDSTGAAFWVPAWK